jgi:hypothetical protein
MDRSQRLWMLALLMAVLMGACTSRTEKTVTELDKLLGELRVEYAPDERTAWWHPSAGVVDKEVVLSGEVDKPLAYEAIISEVDARFPEVKNELRLLPEGDDGVVVNGLVNNSVIHLRAEPSSKKELVTQARLGAPIRILKTEGGKSLIQVPDGYLGWVNTAELHVLEPWELEAYKEAEKVIFTPQYGMSYQGPDEASMPVSDLVIGNILVRVSEALGFSQVRYPDGRLAWVKSDALVPAEEIFYKTPVKENLVRTAMQFHGIPYLWGGTSSKNIDCSGLICNVYFMNGIQLPRDADMQALIGQELHTEFVDEGLEPGDLLFFGRKAGEGREESVTHVAMYIGGGEFIHSAGYQERVSINSMDSTQANFIERYPEIFVRSVRILGEEPVGFRPIYENMFYQEIISLSE